MCEDVEMVEVEFELPEELVEKARRNADSDELDEQVRELYRQVAIHGEVVRDV